MEKGRAYGPCCASSEVRRTQSGKSLDLAAIDPLFLGLRQGFSIFFFFAIPVANTGTQVSAVYKSGRTHACDPLAFYFRAGVIMRAFAVVLHGEYHRRKILCNCRDEVKCLPAMSCRTISMLALVWLEG